MRLSRLFLTLAITLAGVASLAAQPVTSPRAPAGEARRTEYRRRLEQFWLEAEKVPDAPAQLKALLGEEGLLGPQGSGPSITVVATSPQAARVTLAAVKAIQRKQGWRGKIHAAPSEGAALDPTLLAIGISDQLRRPVMSVHKPFISSLEVIDLQGSPGRDQLAAFTEISLASQLFRGADDVDFRLARLQRDNAKFSLKSYDLQSREEFLAELKESVSSEGQNLVFKSSAPLLTGLPRRSQTMRLRSLLMHNWPQDWAETLPLDFFQIGVPAPSPGGEIVNLWISDQMAGVEAAEKIYYSLLELLDSTPPR